MTARDQAAERSSASGELHRSVVDALREGVVVMRLDGQVLQANDAAGAILGADPGRDTPAGGWWAGLDVRDPDGIPVPMGTREATAEHTRARDVAVSIRHADGTRRILRLNCELLRDAAEHLVISFHDITEHDAARKRLVLTESRLRDAHERAGLSSWEWTVADGRVVVLQALPGQLGEERMDIEALLAPVPAEDRRRITGCIDRMRARASGDEVLQYRYRLQDGLLAHVETRLRAVRAADGALTSVRGTTQDVTARVQGEAELRSAHGHLRAVTDSMAEGMCTLDADGRATYLNAAAERLLGWPAAELVGRRFCDVTHAGEADGSPHAAHECPLLHARRDGDVVHSDDEVFIRSDGSAVPVECNAAPFETADGFRGTVLLFSDISERKARETRERADLADLAWVERINHAIENDLLVLYAQPIVDIATGETVQHELLIRMLEADGTAIPPGAFLPAAERFGLIREIDRWVVRRGAELSAQGHAVELNISAESLGSADFALVVEREMRDAGADFSRIVIELTETAVLRDEEAAERFVARVQALGCGLALDDFGTGYGGFTYLKRLSVDLLKIDVEFVRDLAHNAASQHVVRAVVNLAADFGQKTVAEGVEDAETLAVLRDLGVDYAQGFHLGRPAPLEQTLLAHAAHDRRIPSQPAGRARPR